MKLYISLLLLAAIAFRVNGDEDDGNEYEYEYEYEGYEECNDSGDEQVTEECKCGAEDNICIVGDYCIFTFCSEYPRCDCHSTHANIKSPTPRTNPVCKAPRDPVCLSSIPDEDGATCDEDSGETLCIIAIPPCNCLNSPTPWSPDAVDGLVDFELNKFSCFDPQYRHRAEIKEGDIYDQSGELLHRYSDGKHRCFYDENSYDTSSGLCTGTTRRRCRLLPGAPSVAPSPYPTDSPTATTDSPTTSALSPPPTIPLRRSRGDMGLTYGVNLKTPQIQIGIAADESSMARPEAGLEENEEEGDEEEEEECTNVDDCNDNADEVTGTLLSGCQCTCSHGWEGDQCETEVQCTMSDVDCNDHADGVTGTLSSGCQCTCSHRWEGDACEDRVQCVTNSDEICIFPFVYRDVTYEACTDVYLEGTNDASDTFWCATAGLNLDNYNFNGESYNAGICNMDTCSEHVNPPCTNDANCNGNVAAEFEFEPEENVDDGCDCGECGDRWRGDACEISNHEQRLCSNDVDCNGNAAGLVTGMYDEGCECGDCREGWTGDKCEISVDEPKICSNTVNCNGNAYSALYVVGNDRDGCHCIQCEEEWGGDDCGIESEFLRRVLSSQQWLKSSVFFGAALAAIGFGFGIAGYYATKVIFKRTANQEEQI